MNANHGASGSRPSPGRRPAFGPARARRQRRPPPGRPRRASARPALRLDLGRPPSGRRARPPAGGRRLRLPPLHRPRRHRRLLRRRRGPAQPRPAGPAGHRRRPAPRAGRGLDLLLRGPPLRRPLRHGPARPPTSSAPRASSSAATTRSTSPSPSASSASSTGYTPDVEETSIDEAYLDLTRCRHLYPSFTGGRPRPQGAQSSARPGSRSRSASAPNKILAKLATQQGQAGRLSSRSRPAARRSSSATSPSTACPASAPRPRSSCGMLNIQKIGDLWGLPRATLHSIFGLGGDDIYLQSRGIDSRPLVTSAVPKSVSRETTFLEDLWDKRLLLAHLAYLCDRLTLALRAGPLLRPRHRGQGPLRRLPDRGPPPPPAHAAPGDGRDLPDRRGALPAAPARHAAGPAPGRGQGLGPGPGPAPVALRAVLGQGRSGWARPWTRSGTSTASAPS